MMILSTTYEFSRRSRVNTWPLKQANLEWAYGYITQVFLLDYASYRGKALRTLRLLGQ